MAQRSTGAEALARPPTKMRTMLVFASSSAPAPGSKYAGVLAQPVAHWKPATGCSSARARSRLVPSASCRRDHDSSMRTASARRATEHSVWLV